MEQAKLQWAERVWGRGKGDIIFLGCHIHVASKGAMCGTGRGILF